MEFRLLGSVEAWREGVALALGGPKQRALLAILLLNANEAVSRDRLVEGLWGERPPPSAAHSLDDYVSRLRKTIGADRVVTRAPGYVLRLEPDELDIERFEALLEQGRQQLAAGQATEAARTLRTGLELWRGAALSDLLYEPFAALEADRLEGRRLLGLEQRLEADLTSGGGTEFVSELEELTEQHPFRERLAMLLMLCLYRAGRQADALDVYRRARRRLAEDLGLEPGPQLQELERRILQHDPALLAARAATTAVRRQDRRRFTALGALLGALLLAGVLSFVLHTSNRGAANVGDAAGNQLVSVSSPGNETRSVAITGAPSAVAAGAQSVWVADADANAVLRIDPRNSQVIDRIPLAAQPGGIAVGGGSVWVANAVGRSVFRIDPATDVVTQTIALGVTPSAVAFARGAVWVGDPADQSIIRLDPVTGEPRQTVALTVAPTSLVVAGHDIWVASHDEGTVTDVDPRSGAAVAQVSVGQGPAALAAGAGSLWVANQLDGTVSRVDPRTGSVAATIPTGSGPGSVVFAKGSVWVANEYSQTLSEIDPARDVVVRSIHVEGAPIALAATKTTVWAGTRGVTRHRGGTLMLLSHGAFASIDPAFDFQVFPLQLQALSHDALVTFAHVGGASGMQLVPDLAVSLPRPTDSGRTYAFRLRPNIRYSNGDRLHATDVRRAFERLFQVGSPITGYFAQITGAAGCTPHASCDLSAGIVVSDLARAVTFHLNEPDPEFLFKLAFLFTTPIPAGTPIRNLHMTPIPGTGPYRIVQDNTESIKLTRNPFFREWSRAAQPDGNPDVIIWKFGLSLDAEVREIERGTADWMFDAVPGSRLHEVQTRFAGQLHANPSPQTDFFRINTQLPPFDHVDVRRALNFAIDREQIAETYGGTTVAAPTCQVLPPGVPGYVRYCPYTLAANDSGAWTAPDLAQARRLVKASNTQGAAVTVFGFTDDPSIRPKVARIVALTLRRLGYHASVRLISHASLDRLSRPERSSIQLMPGAWYADYPAASDFFGLLLSCNGTYNGHFFCNPRIDNMMRQATSLQVTDPRRSARIWAAVDHAAVDEAAWVPLVNPETFEFVSSRVHSYQHNPLWGFIADQAWLR